MVYVGVEVVPRDHDRAHRRMFHDRSPVSRGALSQVIGHHGPVYRQGRTDHAIDRETSPIAPGSGDAHPLPQGGIGEQARQCTGHRGRVVRRNQEPRNPVAHRLGHPTDRRSDHGDACRHGLEHDQGQPLPVRAEHRHRRPHHGGSAVVPNAEKTDSMIDAQTPRHLHGRAQPGPDANQLDDPRDRSQCGQAGHRAPQGLGDVAGEAAGCSLLTHGEWMRLRSLLEQGHRSQQGGLILGGFEARHHHHPQGPLVALRAA